MTKLPIVAPVAKPEPFTVMVCALAPTPTPLVPVAYVVELIEGAVSTEKANGADVVAAPVES